MTLPVDNTGLGFGFGPGKNPAISKDDVNWVCETYGEEMATAAEAFKGHVLTGPREHSDGPNGRGEGPYQDGDRAYDAYYNSLYAYRRSLDRDSIEQRGKDVALLVTMRHAGLLNGGCGKLFKEGEYAGDVCGTVYVAPSKETVICKTCLLSLETKEAQ